MTMVQEWLRMAKDNMETPLDTKVYDPWMIKPTLAGNGAYIRSF